MAWQLTPYALPSLIAGSLSVVLGVVCWRRGRQQGRALAVLALASGWWSLLQTLGVTAVDLAAKVWLAKIQYLGIVIVPPAWLVVALTARAVPSHGAPAHLDGRVLLLGLELGDRSAVRHAGERPALGKVGRLAHPTAEAEAGPGDEIEELGHRVGALARVEQCVGEGVVVVKVGCVA